MITSLGALRIAQLCVYVNAIRNFGHMIRGF